MQSITVPTVHQLDKDRFSKCYDVLCDRNYNEALAVQNAIKAHMAYTPTKTIHTEEHDCL